MAAAFGRLVKSLFNPFPIPFFLNMKNAECQLQVVLTVCLQLNLNGLNEKHTKKFKKTVARTVKQLARNSSKRTAKELKNNKNSVQTISPRVQPKLAIHTTRTVAKRSAATKAATKK